MRESSGNHLICEAVGFYCNVCKDKGCSETRVSWHFRGLGLVLPDQAVQTPMVHMRRERRSSAELEAAGDVGGWRSVWELREGEVSACEHFQRNRANRCCSLGIVQFTNEY